MLQQAEGGEPAAKLCREHGMSNGLVHKWRAKNGGMDVLLISQMEAIGDEDRLLKRMYAGLSMQADLLKKSLRKKLTGPSQRRELTETAVARRRVTFPAGQADVRSPLS